MLTEAIWLANCFLLPQNAGPTILLNLISLNLILQYSKLPFANFFLSMVRHIQIRCLFPSFYLKGQDILPGW